MARISEAMGRPPMPLQRLVWDVALEVQSEAAGDPSPGEWAYDDVRWTMERQTGKTTGLRPVIVHRCGRAAGARVFMTAQKRDKARARWMDATGDILRSKLAGDVKRKVSIGHEELRWLRNDSTCVPFAPNDEDMHGETPDLVLVDEQWAFGEEQARALMGAYVPGFTTKDGQAWKTSTAGTSKSWWLNQERRTGRRAVEQGVNLGVAYFETSLPDEWDGRAIEDLSDAELVQACIDNHPALGYTLRPQALWSAWTAMDGDRAEFLRAYGNRTAEDLASTWQAVEEDEWLRAASPRTIPEDVRVGIGFDVDPDRRDAAVVAAWRGPDGRMVTEVIRRDLGTRWVAPYVVGLVERQSPVRVAFNNAGPARDVADELQRAGVELLAIGMADYAAACQRHADELAARRWLHPNDPDLNAAVEVADWRKVGMSRAWAMVEEPITTLAATTVAGWAFDHPAEEETPLPKFWMG